MKSLLSILRWNLKLTRYLERFFNQIKGFKKLFRYKRIVYTQSEYLLAFNKEACLKLESIENLPQINLDSLKGRANGKAFIDLANEYSETVTSIFNKVMCQEGVEDFIVGYFNGKPWLWNCALNYSDPSKQQTGSQLWHFDYGDTKQLHLMLYFSKVDEDSGPFTFLPHQYSKMVKRNTFLIERLTDEDLKHRYNYDVKELQSKLIGDRGDLFSADPGKLMHQGARAIKPRLVMFITFTTPSPTSHGGKSVMNGEMRRKLFKAYQEDCKNGILTKEVFL